MLKKILVINEKYSDNIGDQAISRAMSEFCNVNDNVSVDTVDFSFRKQPAPKLSDVKKNIKPSVFKKLVPVFAKKIIFFIKNIKNARDISRCGYDLIIIGGGQLLLGKGTFPYSLFLYTFFLQRSGARIKIVATGVGKKFSTFEHFLIAQSLKRVEAIYLRDTKSNENLKANFNKNSDFIPDIAYFLYDESLICKHVNKIIICPTEYYVYERYKDEVDHKNLTVDEYKKVWLDIIENSMSKFDEIILTATTNNDYKFCQSLNDSLPNLRSDQIVIKKIDDMCNFILLAKDASEIISGRMHALILCHNLNLRITPFYISQKIISYNEEYLNNDAKFFNERIQDLRMEIIR